MLALGYPGGPIIDQLAALAPRGGASAGGHGAPPKFATPKLRGNPHDFSFSGIKTAVLYYVRDHSEFAPEISERRAAVAEGKRSAAELFPLCSRATLDLIVNFQSAVVRDLVSRTLAAAREISARSILVSGGVAANSELRRVFEQSAREAGLPVFFPTSRPGRWHFQKFVWGFPIGVSTRPPCRGCSASGAVPWRATSPVRPPWIPRSDFGRLRVH